MRKEGAFHTFAKALLDDSIRSSGSLAGPYKGACEAYDRLRRHVQQQSHLLSSSRCPGCCWTPANIGLLALAIPLDDWLRPPETWYPPTDKSWPLFTSLAHHLFARYPVPKFMSSVWFDSHPWQKLPQHGWYKHLGLGQNIRTAGLPLRFTKAMAHLFCQAPDHFSVFAALRWGQVRGLGGQEPLARALIATRLGRVFENEDFWETVLHFFIRGSLQLTTPVLFRHEQEANVSQRPYGRTVATDSAFVAEAEDGKSGTAPHRRAA